MCGAESDPTQYERPMAVTPTKPAIHEVSDGHGHRRVAPCCPAEARRYLKSVASRMRADPHLAFALATDPDFVLDSIENGD